MSVQTGKNVTDRRNTRRANPTTPVKSEEITQEETKNPVVLGQPPVDFDDLSIDVAESSAPAEETDESSSKMDDSAAPKSADDDVIVLRPAAARRPNQRVRRVAYEDETAESESPAPSPAKPNATSRAAPSVSNVSEDKQGEDEEFDFEDDEKEETDDNDDNAEGEEDDGDEIMDFDALVPEDDTPASERFIERVQNEENLATVYHDLFPDRASISDLSKDEYVTVRDTLCWIAGMDETKLEAEERPSCYLLSFPKYERGFEPTHIRLQLSGASAKDGTKYTMDTPHKFPGSGAKLASKAYFEVYTFKGQKSYKTDVAAAIELLNHFLANRE